MIFVISPAKAMDFDTPAPVAETTLPDFLDRAQELVGRLRRLTPAELQELMDLSDKLAALNVGRYAAWSPEHTPNAAKAALFAWRSTRKFPPSHRPLRSTQGPSTW